MIVYGPNQNPAESLDADSLIAADRAFLDSQAAGGSVAQSVRHAIAAYVADVRDHGGQEAGQTRQVLATLPEGHPDLAGGQVLVRSFDGGQSWEVCTRPDTYSTWSLGVSMVSA